MSAWDDSDLPSNPSASKPSSQQGLSDTQLAELSESISSALKKFKDACAVVGTAKDNSKLRAGIKSTRDQLKSQLQRVAAECNGSKTMTPIQQQKLLRTIAEMQKDFDNVVLENQRKERLHAVPDDTGSRGGDFGLGSRSGAGSGADFMNIDSATPLLKEQQRVQVLRVGGKEVVQHDVAAVEAQFQQEQLSAFSRLESDLAGLAEVYQEVAILTVEQGVAITQVEQNVQTAVDNVVQGNSELNQAVEHQKSARKKMLCIICTLLIMAGVGVGIYYAVRGNNS